MVDNKYKQVAPEWDRLIALSAKVGYGYMTVVIKDGIPVRAENITKQVRLDKTGFSEDLEVTTL